MFTYEWRSPVSVSFLAATHISGHFITKITTYTRLAPQFSDSCRAYVIQCPFISKNQRTPRLKESSLIAMEVTLMDGNISQLNQLFS